jgi:hypothetical protein
MERERISATSVFTAVLAMNVVAIALAMLLGEPPGRYFKEGGYVTFLSFVQLLAISGIAWAVFRVRKGASRIDAHGRLTERLWLLIAVSFFFLAFDEVIEIHENIDKLIHYLLGIEETGLTDRIDDFIVVGYGFVALIVLFIYRDELRRYRQVLPRVVLFFSLVFVMMVLDILTNRDDIIRHFVEDTGSAVRLFEWLDAFEDACKMIAEAILIGAALRCLEIARSRESVPGPR